MKKFRFTDNQIIAALKQAEAGKPAPGGSCANHMAKMARVCASARQGLTVLDPGGGFKLTGNQHNALPDRHRWWLYCRWETSSFP